MFSRGLTVAYTKISLENFATTLTSDDERDNCEELLA